MTAASVSVVAGITGRFAGRADRLEPAFDRVRNGRDVRRAGESHRLREIRRADEKCVDAFDAENVVDFATASWSSIGTQTSDCALGLGGEIRHARAEAPAVGARAVTALLRGPPIAIIPAAAAAIDMTSTSAGTDRPILAVDQHPVKTGIGQHLDELRRGKHQRDPERDIAAADLVFHWILHRARLCACLHETAMRSRMIAAQKSCATHSRYASAHQLPTFHWPQAPSPPSS